MAVYGIITETSIGGLFFAGFIPGVISALVYSATILAQFYFNPTLGEPSVGGSWQERWTTLPEVAPIVMVIGVVIGGMYTGWATPTEVGALGAFIIFVMALLRRMMSYRALLNSLIDTAKLSVMIFSIIWGVLIFVRFLAFAGISASFQAWILALGVSPYLVLFCVILLYIVLGMFMDGIGMLLLTLPVVHPVMINLGFNSIWFGIIVVKMVEVGLLTPPVGLNCYVVAGVPTGHSPAANLSWHLAVRDRRYDLCTDLYSVPRDRDLPAEPRAWIESDLPANDLRQVELTIWGLNSRWPLGSAFPKVLVALRYRRSLPMSMAFGKS